MKYKYLKLSWLLLLAVTVTATEPRFNKATACGKVGNAANNSTGTVYIINHPYVAADATKPGLFDPAGMAILFTAKDGVTPGIIISGKNENDGVTPLEVNCSSGINIQATGCFIRGSGTGVPPGDVDYRAETRIYLKDGFVAKEGSRFHAYIAPTWNTSWERKFECYDAVQASSSGPTIENEWMLATNIATDIPSLVDLVPESGLYSLKSLQLNNKNSFGEIRSIELSSRNHFYTNDKTYARYEGYINIDYDGNYDSTINRPAVAFWLMGHDGAATGLAEENDILERSSNKPVNGGNYNNPFTDGWDQAQVGYYDDGQFFQQTIGYQYIREYNIEGWHLYSTEITRDEIRFLLDDGVIHRLPNLHANESFGNHASFNTLLRSPEIPYRFIMGIRDNGIEQTIKVNYIKILESN